MGEKKKFDNRIIIGIAVAAAIVGVVIYAVFGGKGDKENGLSSLYSEPAQSVVSAEQSEISEGISGQPLEQSQADSEAAPPQADTTQTAAAQDGQQQSSDEGFRLPDDIVNALNTSRYDLFGSYVPAPHWHNEGGDSYDIGQLTYNFYAGTDYSEPPASITGNVSILFPERSYYTGMELKFKLGNCFISDTYDENAFSAYCIQAKWQGYTITFSSDDPSMVKYVEIRSPKYSFY